MCNPDEPESGSCYLKCFKRDAALNRGKRRRTGMGFFYCQIVRAGFELYFSIC